MSTNEFEGLPLNMVIAVAEMAVHRDKAKNRVHLAGDAAHAHAVEELVRRVQSQPDESETRELAAIRRIFRTFDEFGEPLDPECQLPEVAEQVFFVLCSADSYKKALERIAEWDVGLLGGDPSWSVECWHDYIRSLLFDITHAAKKGLESEE